jgi:hypothetical protein
MNKFILALCITTLFIAWIGFPGFGIIKCPYKVSTGKPCVFCGTMTSLSCAVCGNIKDALIINPVGVFVFFTIAASIVFLSYRVIKGVK